MKVYGFTTTACREWGARTREVRVIVGARSLNAAAQAFRGVGLDTSDYFCRQYVSISANDAELAATAAAPGVVLFADERARTADAYRPVSGVGG